MRARSLLPIVTLLLAPGARGDAPDASVPVERSSVGCLTAEQAEERAREALRQRGPLGMNPYVGPLSPPLPVTWPPAGRPVARFYAFHSVPLPTGIVAFRDWSPHAVAEVPLKGGAPRQLPLKARVLGRSEATPGDGGGPVDRAADALLQALCRAELPTGAEAELIRAGYRAWNGARPLIATELRTHAPAFFAWLEGTGADAR